MACWLCGFEATELDTNEIVSPCKNGPCPACIAVAKVDEEIKQAVATLQRLVARRRDLHSEQNRVHPSLIHRLPIELKKYILELLLPSWNGWDSDTRPGGFISPLYLASVCRTWRDIACSTPLLWSAIHINIGREGATPPCSQINFIHDWILRSRTMPLTLYIDVGVETEGCKDELKDVLHAISKSSNRWHSLSLHIPLSALSAFQHSVVQCHLLKRLRLHTTMEEPRYTTPLARDLSFLGPEVSPEEIETYAMPFRFLKISWNHLSSAKLCLCTSEEITLLFQHASQMTVCDIFFPRGRDPSMPSMPSITHHRLKTLGLGGGARLQILVTILGSLTLPSLQEFHTDTMDLLHPAHFPAFVQRSSCPLTKLKLSIVLDESRLGDLQPIPGVTDLVLHKAEGEYVGFKKLLLEGYFPDLHRLTLQPESFLHLWKIGIISKLVGSKRLLPDAPNEGSLRKILVIDSDRYPAAEPNTWIWDLDIGRELKSMRLDMNLKEDGFEIMIPKG